MCKTISSADPEMNISSHQPKLGYPLKSHRPNLEVQQRSYIVTAAGVPPIQLPTPSE